VRITITIDVEDGKGTPVMTVEGPMVRRQESASTQAEACSSTLYDRDGKVIATMTVTTK